MLQRGSIGSTQPHPSQMGTLLSSYGTRGSCSIPGPMNLLCKRSGLEEAADLLSGPPNPSLLPLDWDKALPQAHPAQSSSQKLPIITMHRPKDVLPLCALSPNQPHSTAVSETPHRSTLCTRAS